jgi:hypothetical protein
VNGSSRAPNRDFVRRTPLAHGADAPGTRRVRMVTMRSASPVLGAQHDPSSTYSPTCLLSRTSAHRAATARQTGMFSSGRHCPTRCAVRSACPRDRARAATLCMPSYVAFRCPRRRIRDGAATMTQALASKRKPSRRSRSVAHTRFGDRGLHRVQRGSRRAVHACGVVKARNVGADRSEKRRRSRYLSRRPRVRRPGQPCRARQAG